MHACVRPCVCECVCACVRACARVCNTPDSMTPFENHLLRIYNNYAKRFSLIFVVVICEMCSALYSTQQMSALRPQTACPTDDD